MCVCVCVCVFHVTTRLYIYPIPIYVLLLTMYVMYITNLRLSPDSNSECLYHNRILPKFHYVTVHVYFPFTFVTMLHLQLKQSR